MKTDITIKDLDLGYEHTRLWLDMIATSRYLLEKDLKAVHAQVKMADIRRREARKEGQ